MGTSYPRLSVAQWKPWGQNLVTVVGPRVVELGIPADLWAAVTTTFGTFADAYDAAAEAMTRNRASIQTRNDALVAFRRAARPVVAVLQSSPAVSNGLRQSLGLRVRDGVNTAATTPAVAPSLTAMLTGPQSLRMIAADPLDPHRRGKPRGVRSLAVHVHRGENPPGDVTQWALERLSSRTTLDLIYPDLTGVTTVWLCACYVNTRNESGPLSQPVSVRLPGSGLTGTEASAADPAMKIAA